MNTYYGSKNGVDDLRRAQRFAAKMVLVLATALAILAACTTALPAHAQASNATLPPSQRCDLIASVAYTAAEARDEGRTAQDTHLQFDSFDPKAATVIDQVYSNPAAANSPPREVAASASRACTRVFGHE